LAAAQAPAKPGAEAASPAKRTCSRFAAPGGSDSRSGTLKRPFRTAQRLVNSLRPGQTGCLRRGRYLATSDEFVVRFDRGGRSGARITLRSYPGERATLVGNLDVMKGSDYVTLSHLRIDGTGGQNTVKIYAANTILEDSDITNAWRGLSCAILGSDSYGVASRPLVRRNRFHQCGSLSNGNQDHAVYAQSVADGRIIGNVFWDSAAYAIQLYPNAQRTLVAYNVIDGGRPSVRGGIVFGGEGSEASSNNVVTRNVIAYAEDNIGADWGDVIGTGNVAAKNCVWGGRQSNIDDSDGGFRAYANVIARPAFRDRRTRDYRLSATSRCRNVVG
jgi:Right handed beta helix region